MRSGLAVAERGWDAAPRGQADVLAFPARASDPAANRLLAIVARHRGIEPARLLSRSRCTAEVALSRQVAMYLMHVAMGRSYSDVGRVFGRDRTTVSHACALIEDRRERAAFDAALDEMEAELMAAGLMEVTHAV